MEYRHLLILVVALLITSPGNVAGQTPLCTITWTSAVDGNWSDSTKWSPASVPTAADDVCITSEGAYTVTLNGSQAVNSVTLGANTGVQTLRVEANHLTGGDAVLSVASGFINDGTIELTSTGAARSATLNVADGTLLNLETGVIDVLAGSGGGRAINAQVDNQGTVNVDNSVSLGQEAAAHLNSGYLNINSPTATLTVTSSSSSFVNLLGGVIAGHGTLNMTGVNFTNSGTVKPGSSAGHIHITGDFVQSSKGSLDIELEATPNDSEFDQLSISVTAELGGTLNIFLIGSSTLVLGQAFEVITFASRVGEFSNITGSLVDEGLIIHVEYNTSNVTLRVIDGICGDQNYDGVVNVFDAIIDLQIIVGLIVPTEAQRFLSDLNRDGKINVFDVITTLQHIVGLIEITECGPSPG